MTDDSLHLERLLPAAVAVAFRAPAFDTLLYWAQENIDAFIAADSSAHGDPDFARAFAFAFSRALWNAMPLTDTGRPAAAVPDPGRNEPCPCGSTRKYKQCCARAPSFSGAIDATLLWPYVLEILPRAQRNTLAAGTRIPLHALAAFAELAIDSDCARDAVDVLEPRLGSPEQHHGEDVAGLVDLLCDAYDGCERTSRRKIAFLESTTQRAPRSPLRSEAWQRLATIYMDAGRNDDAWHAVRQGQRDDPHSPALPMLEVYLLVVEGRTDEARQRADFWIRALERSGAKRDPDDHRMEFLHQVRRDPVSAVGDAAMGAGGGAAKSLARWIKQHIDRETPQYALATVDFGDAAKGDVRELQHPASLDQVEREWKTAFPFDKPFSIHDQPFDHREIWEPDIAERWMAALHAHPEAFDSMTILDDLTTAVVSHPSVGAPGFNEALLVPLLARSNAILAHALEQAPAAILPWLIAENRPALRALNRQHMLCVSHEDETAALAVAERLLRLNPGDNHGMRCELVNEYLRRGDNQSALEIATQYPDDMSPETRFGWVLALFRLRRFADADAALQAARIALPQVIPYLLPGRIKRPKLSDTGVTIGGEDQAWLYRDAMRSIWMESDGAKAWLEKMSRLM